MPNEIGLAKWAGGSIASNDTGYSRRALSMIASGIEVILRSISARLTKRDVSHTSARRVYASRSAASSRPVSQVPP